jgi:hypothetical protein
VVLSAAVAFVALALPFVPWADQALEVSPLPIALLATALAIAAAYAATTEVAKRCYFKLPDLRTAAGRK